MNFYRNEYSYSDNCCLHFVSLHLCGYNKVQKKFVSAPILTRKRANLPCSFWVQGEAMLLKQSIKKYLQDTPDKRATQLQCTTLRIELQ